MDAKEHFEKLSSEQKNQNKIFVEAFYDSVVRYLELWSGSLDGTECFTWLSLTKTPNWDDVEKSFKFVEIKSGKEVASLIYGKSKICSSKFQNYIFSFEANELFNEILISNGFVDSHELF